MGGHIFLIGLLGRFNEVTHLNLLVYRVRMQKVLVVFIIT